MTRLPLGCAVAIVRAWTRVYTWRAPGDVATNRRAEIESDLWEFAADTGNGPAVTAAFHVLVRLVNGMRDDVCWRVEQLDASEALVGRRLLAVTCSILLMLAALLLPARLPRGRADVAQCANAAPPADSTATYRLQIISCAGAFFRARP